MLQYRYEETAGLSKDALDENMQAVEPHLDALRKDYKTLGYEMDSAFLNLPKDSAMVDEVERVVKILQNEKLRFVVVVGIGGSELGAKAVYEALRFREGREDTGHSPELLFLSTINEVKMASVLEKLLRSDGGEEFALVLVSKSGKTTETITNAAYLFEKLREKFGDISSRVVCVTDTKTKLWQFANTSRFHKILIPKNVGGRFSVFSPVGILPLSLAGFDVPAFLKGAESMTEKCFAEDLFNNPALLGASIGLFHYKEERRVHNFFIFNPWLESVGKWWRQLTGESLGKEFDTHGKEVNAGVVPLVSIGTDDLHSVGQLYLALGKEPIFTTFLSVKDESKAFSISPETLFEELLPAISGKTSGEVTGAIYEGVKTSYLKRGLPFSEVVFSEKNEETLGEFFQMKMIETVLLARALDINPFDQPNVEEYKNETRSLLDS